VRGLPNPYPIGKIFGVPARLEPSRGSRNMFTRFEVGEEAGHE
jgi:hypothetical protein